jgi:hypothetical protein
MDPHSLFRIQASKSNFEMFEMLFQTNKQVEEQQNIFRGLVNWRPETINSVIDD